MNSLEEVYYNSIFKQMKSWEIFKKVMYQKRSNQIQQRIWFIWLLSFFTSFYINSYWPLMIASINMVVGLWEIFRLDKEIETFTEEILSDLRRTEEVYRKFR